MNEPRSGHHNGATRVRFERRAPEAPRPDGPALGDVARDVMDHASMMVRDELELFRLEADRYVDHLKRDVARRALLGVGVAVCGGLAAVMGLLAVFLGLAHALGSVAWTFAIFAVLFAVLTAVAVATLAAQRRRAGERPRLRAEDVFERVPYTQAHPHEHALAPVVPVVDQRSR